MHARAASASLLLSCSAHRNFQHVGDGYPTDLFAILKPQFHEIGKFYVVQERRVRSLKIRSCERAARVVLLKFPCSLTIFLEIVTLLIVEAVKCLPSKDGAVGSRPGSSTTTTSLPTCYLIGG